MRDRVTELRARRRTVGEAGGADRVAKQHAAGKLTARERLALLFEADSFQETHRFVRHRSTSFGMADKEFPGEGVVTGHGLVDGRPAYAASQDFTVGGGSVGEATAFKITEIMDLALKTGAPFVFINDGAGARIQEGVHALSGYGRIFYRNVLLSGVVPQISIIAGPCAGGAAYSPALTDFIIQVRHAGQMYITGPSVIREVTGEEVTAEQLGGVECHAHYSGVVHFVAETGAEAMQIARRLLSFLPANNTELAPRKAVDGVVVLDPALNEVVPIDARVPYDMHQVIGRVVDDGDFLEVQAHYAPNLIIGFGRVLGQTVGVVANQPNVRAGVLDIDASDKASRFVRFCNAFNIPLVTLVDVPGFLPGVRQEIGGIIRHGAKMLFAYAAATVPKITIVVRKAYGGAYLAMCARDLGADKVAAWPTGEIAVMGAPGAVNILYRDEIKGAEDPVAERAARMGEYAERFSTPYEAAAAGLVDDVIEPSETRAYIATALEFLASKRELRPQKKHGLIPM
ncbi:MAG: methylmalonyl-CoA carboxyltransferase [Deltaproteobacteria bacterium HGW-Deltaproteobacteria-14]|jgi:methylmalonyl-CoA carboxyltransferase large subunit|nr:MAG: methylmalonyl-CoA carboxyltransferase [Deltaproteobacteria bacterium HGW-Deltaproteobacteria-14]